MDGATDDDGETVPKRSALKGPGDKEWVTEREKCGKILNVSLGYMPELIFKDLSKRTWNAAQEYTRNF